LKNLCFDLYLVYDKAYAFREFNMVNGIKMRENNSQQSRTRPWFSERTTDIEYQFLKQRRRRGEDFESDIRIFIEFLKDFESLDIEDPCVIMFGSAGFSEQPSYLSRIDKLY
jgi:hypothetical protein